MCKVFAMTNMRNVALTAKFIGSVRDAVCKAGDKDGFGYATVDDAGNLFGERTTQPFTFGALAGANDPAGGLPIVASVSDSFGTYRPGAPVKAMIAHGRMSTNTVSLANTHPFVGAETALIHNGVVSDMSGKLKGTLRTDCDTEILLRHWERGGMDAIEGHSAGYYAIAVLDSAGLLHLARDARAKLVLAYSSTVDSYIIATTAEIIAQVAKSNAWNVGPVHPVLDNTYFVFNGNTLENHREISPLGYASSISTAAVSRSLGATDTDDDADGATLDLWAETDAEDDTARGREIADDDGPAYYTWKTGRFGR